MLRIVEQVCKTPTPELAQHYTPDYRPTINISKQPSFEDIFPPNVLYLYLIIPRPSCRCFAIFTKSLPSFSVRLNMLKHTPSNFCNQIVTKVVKY